MDLVGKACHIECRTFHGPAFFGGSFPSDGLLMSADKGSGL
jgi:hypothetical protein